MAVNQDFSVFQGQDITLTFRCVANAIDITGYSLVFTVRDYYQGPVRLVKTTADGSIVLLDPVDGIFTVALTSLDLRLDPRVYFWDVRRTDSGGRDSLAWGAMIVQPTTL